MNTPRTRTILNKKLAAAGLALMILGVAAGTSASPSGEELTNSEALGTVSVSPSPGPNSVYANLSDGELNISVKRLNPRSTTLIDGIFDVSYDGEGTGEFWIKNTSDEVTFYESEGRASIEGEPNSVELDSGDSVSVGARFSPGGRASIFEDITLVASIPTADDLKVSVPDTGSGGSSGGAGVGVPEELRDDTDDTDDGGAGRKTRLSVDIGDLNVKFLSPEFEFEASVSDTEITVHSGLSGGVATVLDNRDVSTDETVVVKSRVTNTGSAAGETTAELRVNGRVLDERSVDLAPGESTNVSFVVGFSDPGRYDVSVGDSEPVTVFVTDEGFDVLPIAVLVGLALLAALVGVWRRREEG